MWNHSIVLIERRDISSNICGIKTGYFWRDFTTFPAVFVAGKLGVFKETSGHFQPFVAQNSTTFLVRHCNMSSCVYWWQNGIFLTFPATFAATKVTLRWRLQARDHCLRCHVNIQYVSMQPLVTFDKICDIFQPCLWQRNRVDNPTHHLLYLNLTRP